MRTLDDLDADLTGKRAVVRVDFVNGVDASNGTTTSLRTFDTRGGTTIRTRSGYDDITGIGTPNGERFLAAVRFPG